MIGRSPGCVGHFLEKNADPIIALATIVLALATYRLWGSTGSLVRDARDNAQRQLRAYVGVKACNLDALPAAGEIPPLGVELHNFGQTPAYAVAFEIDWTIDDFPHRMEPEEFARLAKRLRTTTIVLDPHEGRKAHLDPSDTRPLTAADAEAARTGQMVRAPGISKEARLYALGILRYTDVFGVQHNRRFCHIYGGGWGVVARYCSFHNDAD